MSEDFYTKLADTLHAIASDLHALADSDLSRDLYVSLTIQPGEMTDEETIRTIDGLGRALLDKAGQTVEMSGGSYHHSVKGSRGGGYRVGVAVSVFSSVKPPEQRALQAEIERSRAELERLHAELDAARGKPASTEDGEPL